MAERRLYVGNLDQRVTEANVIKMFSPFGKIVSEDFLWHTRGPKKGEPRGFVFIQYSTKEEAQLAKTQMNGRLACGRPLVVRYAGEKHLIDAKDPLKSFCDVKNQCSSSSVACQSSRSAKIAAIKSKLKNLEEEDGCKAKKSKQTDTSSGSNEDHHSF